MATSALYACTKCNQRYPFEELSQGQQLCKVGEHEREDDPNNHDLRRAVVCRCLVMATLERFSKGSDYVTTWKMST